MPARDLASLTAGSGRTDELRCAFSPVGIQRLARVIRTTETGLVTTPNGLERFQNYIAGKFVDASDGRTFGSLDPYAGAPWAAIPEGTSRRRRPRRRRRARRPRRRVGRDDRLPARRAHAQARRPDHRERGAARPGRGARQRQALPGDDRPAAGAGRLVPLLRRARRQDRGPGHPDRQAQLLRLHPPRAGRGRRRDHPVELPAAADDLQARPGLAAGCTFVVKPSEHSPASTLAFAQVLHEAGFPDGVFNVVAGSSRELGAALAGHQGVDKVAFTGSTATGRAVAHAAADNLNRVTLELGGKSPQVVFEDADLPGRRQRHHRRRLRRDRPDLHGRVAGDRARERARRAGAAGRRARERDQARRPERPRDRDGPDREPAAVREGARLPRQGQGRGRDGGLRRRGGGELGGLFVKPTLFTGVKPTTRWCARRSSARSPRR